MPEEKDKKESYFQIPIIRPPEMVNDITIELLQLPEPKKISANADEFNMFPDIIVYPDVNPCIYSPNALNEQLSFFQTRETITDVEVYREFLNNAISRFRRSRAYKNYKAYLHALGLDHCQILGNINTEMATVEMHHNFLTIFDIALMITEHIINTIGIICSFDLIQLLALEHQNNIVPIVMLSKTPHQLYHNDLNFYIPPSMTFGRWWELLSKYRHGITIDIAYKVLDYIKRCVDHDDQDSQALLLLRKDILEWSGLNKYGMSPGYCGSIVGY